mmetsp:Transcript_40723/g.109283  ORF Transcript_40723/g.109283 Transcript_40723/m.109283 type:complete len:307 (+) Transcript_40723:102-1022(+)
MWSLELVLLCFVFCMRDARSSLTEFYDLAGAPRTIVGDRSTPQCHSGMCSDLHHYPASGTFHYAEFNVPELPKIVGPTFFVYYNIDWQAPGPMGTDARMNQFVPQLMLGNPLDGSTGPPLFTPLWHKRATWVFGAQYFFEIFNETSNKTQAKAATGTTYPCEPGERLFTSFALSNDWVWTLKMGVVGDSSRLSVVVVKKPFMGLLPLSQTQSWSEPVYADAWSNTCWELYGIGSPDNYPMSDQRTTLTITNRQESVVWGNWSTGQADCKGAPMASIHQTSSRCELHVVWDVNRSGSEAGYDSVLFV